MEFKYYLLVSIVLFFGVNIFVNAEPADLEFKFFVETYSESNNIKERANEEEIFDKTSQFQASRSDDLTTCDIKTTTTTTQFPKEVFNNTKCRHTAECMFDNSTSIDCINGACRCVFYEGHPLKYHESATKCLGAKGHSCAHNYACYIRGGIKPAITVEPTVDAHSCCYRLHAYLLRLDYETMKITVAMIVILFMSFVFTIIGFGVYYTGGDSLF